MCLVKSENFLLVLKKLCTTPGSFYLACTASMIKFLGKATSLLIHARSYPIPKGLQTYKGIHAHIKWSCHQIMQR